MYQSVFRTALFAGQVVVVTGGGSGIGRCVAHELASLGATVALVGRNQDKLEAVQAELQQAAVPEARVSRHSADIRDEAAVKALVAEVLARHGRIDALVNNAGVNKLAPAEEMPLEVWQKVVGVNLTGTFLMCRTFGNRMLQQGHGNIVNVASMSGLVVNPLPQQQCAYNSSKAGVIMLTKNPAAATALAALLRTTP